MACPVFRKDRRPREYDVPTNCSRLDTARCTRPRISRELAELAGPQQNGISAERNLPSEWSTTRNVRWKVALPEAGNSTPIVWGGRIFLTQSLDKGKRRALVCFARADGKKLWQQTVECTVKETTHKDNPPCSSSPVTDGQAI